MPLLFPKGLVQDSVDHVRQTPRLFAELLQLLIGSLKGPAHNLLCVFLAFGVLCGTAEFNVVLLGDVAAIVGKQLSQDLIGGGCSRALTNQTF